MRTSIFIVICGIVSVSSTVQAQAVRASQFQDCKTRLDEIQTSSSADKNLRIRAALDHTQNSPCYARALVDSAAFQAGAFSQLIQDFQSFRNDTQPGSSTGTGGTTSLVSKGLTAKALSIAAESGALTESLYQQTVTVQGSLGGLVSALSQKGLFEYCPGGSTERSCVSRGTLDVLKRISYGVSFDTSHNSQNVSGTPVEQTQDTVQPVTFTADRHEISAWTGRVTLLKTRDANSNTFKQKLVPVLEALVKDPSTASTTAQQAGAAGAALATASKKLLDDITFTDEQNAKRTTMLSQVGQAMAVAVTRADLDALFDQWVDAFVEMAGSSKSVLADAQKVLLTRSAYYLAEEALVSELADQPVLTLEYNNNRPIGQATTSTFRLIFDKGVGKWSFALNGAVTLYDNAPQPPNNSRYRDAQVGAQIQRDIGKLLSVPAALSASYYFQYQNAPAVLNVTPGTPLPGITFTGLPSNADQVFAQTGNLHLGQLRLVLSPGQSNVRFPVAVSYSNRTELINKPTWRAQVGISYDFDSLFAK